MKKRQQINDLLLIDLRLLLLFTLAIVIIVLLINVPAFFELGIQKEYKWIHKPIILPEDIPVDLNKVSPERLQAIPGIGEKSAWKIVHFRQETGWIYDIDLLKRPFGPLSSTQIMHLRCYLNYKDHKM